jgi:hypothetical protein
MGQSLADRALEIAAQQATLRGNIVAAGLIPIDVGILAAALSYSSPVWAPGVYRELLVISKTTGGMVTGGTARITFNGDVSANYDTLSLYAQRDLSITANAVVAGNAGQLALTASAATVPDLYMRIVIDPRKLASGGRPYTCEFHAQGSAAATFIGGNSRGYWKDTTTEMTSLQLAYGSAATGTVHVFGVPA